MYYYVIVVNIISFVLYGIDKYKAKNNKYRIEEETLFTISFLGGCIGSIMGMKVFHHKTKKKVFWIINILSLIIWATLIVKML